MNRKIETENLILITCDQRTLEFALTGNSQLSEYINATVPDNWTEFGPRALKYSLDRIKSNEIELGWWTYLPIHKAENKLIGSCGYKGYPNDKGEVEIGYEIKTEYRNKGFATELVNSLLDNAFSFEKVSVVQAHTLGENNASTKVLSKCGFQKTSDIKDKENGTLWKWELKRKS